MNKNRHIGSDVDDFLREEGILAGVEFVAMERVSMRQIRIAKDKRYANHNQFCNDRTKGSKALWA